MNARKLTLTFLILAGIAASSGGADPIKSLSQKLKRDIKAKECPLLAILNFPYSLGRISTGSTLVSERLLTYLAQENAPLVERRLIQSILEERKMWDTGVIDPGSIKSMGRLLGVDAVVIGTLARQGLDFYRLRKAHSATEERFRARIDSYGPVPSEPAGGHAESSPPDAEETELGTRLGVVVSLA